MSVQRPSFTSSLLGSGSGSSDSDWSSGLHWGSFRGSGSNFGSFNLGLRCGSDSSSWLSFDLDRCLRSGSCGSSDNSRGGLGDLRSWSGSDLSDWGSWCGNDSFSLLGCWSGLGNDDLGILLGWSGGCLGNSASDLWSRRRSCWLGSRLLNDNTSLLGSRSWLGILLRSGSGSSDLGWGGWLGNGSSGLGLLSWLLSGLLSGLGNGLGNRLGNGLGLLGGLGNGNLGILLGCRRRSWLGSGGLWCLLLLDGLGTRGKSEGFDLSEFEVIEINNSVLRVLESIVKIWSI